MTTPPDTTTNATSDPAALREQVRDHYAAAARAITTTNTHSCTDANCCTDSACCTSPISPDSGPNYGPDSTADSGQGGSPFGAGQYAASDRDELPADAVTASLGCGNPVAVADLHQGETVLDLGSGGGIDVLLSARRVGPTGTAYGLDMTDDMLQLARRNAAEAGTTNVEFLKGDMEAIPLPEASIDVVISNCVINLSTDKPAVFAEIFRVLRPGGRLGVSDVVAEDHLTPADRAARGNHVGCIAGCLTITEYRQQLTAAGLTSIEVKPTHAVTDGIHAAIIRATKPSVTPDTASANEVSETSRPHFGSYTHPSMRA